jgi:hypothetical protein
LTGTFWAQSNVGFMGTASLNLKSFNLRNAPILNEHPVEFNIDRLFLDQKLMFFIMKTELYVGVDLTADSMSDFDNTGEQVA